MERHNISVFLDPVLEEVPAEVAWGASVLPRFSDGRLDYSASPDAAVLDCYVYREQELLVLKRSNPLGGLEKPWHVVSGFLDEARPLCDKAMAEIFEEIGGQEILSMYALAPYCSRDSRKWTVYPVAAEVSAESTIRLNEEHSEFAWVPFDATCRYLLPHVCAVWSEHRKRVAKATQANAPRMTFRSKSQTGRPW
jgi:ADP-ribose pyrophosphatase YjhB (NUDIX family)